MARAQSSTAAPAPVAVSTLSPISAHTSTATPNSAAAAAFSASPAVSPNPANPTTARGERVEKMLERYHAFIYNFPVKVMGASEEECADFYVYALEQIRRRKILSAEKYVEREGTKFETWLAVVLRNLYIDLKRAQREPKVDLSDTLESTAAAPGHTVTLETAVEDMTAAEETLGSLKPEGRVLFKLLLLNDMFLSAEDLQLLADRSGRPVAEIVSLLHELESQVSERSQKEQERQEELTRVFWWVEHYRAKLGQLMDIYGDHEERWPARVTERVREIRRKLTKRRRQHLELVRAYRAAGITVKASYEMIAKVLNTTRDAVKMEAYRLRRAYLERVNPDLLQVE